MVSKIIAAFMVVCCFGAEAAGASICAARLDSIVKKATKLADDEAAFWLRYGPDPRGGIYGTIDEDGSHSSIEQKGLIMESRFLWTFSTWYERGHTTAEVKSLCDNLYTFITTKMSLGTSGDFASAVSADGKTITESTRKCYDEAFAIYALSQYGRVFQNQAALDRAMACFNAMLQRAWDDTYLGVDLTKDDQRGTVHPKETNTHIHVMEAFTALYIATKNESVKIKLKIMLDLLCNKIIQPSGYCHITFNRDWSPIGSPIVSYGHDIETSWLMLEAADALGLMNDSLILKKSATIAETSSREGFEKSTGCFFTEGVPHGNVTDASRVWWTQNEGISGHWWRYKLTKDTTYLGRLEAGLRWIANRQISKVNNVCYWQVDAGGNPAGSSGTTMGSFWKANYHTMRSYMFVRDWVLQEIAAAAVHPSNGPVARPGSGRPMASFINDKGLVRLDFPCPAPGAVAIRMLTPQGRCLLSSRQVPAGGMTTPLLFPLPSAATASQYLILEVSAGNRYIVPVMNRR